MTLQHIKPPVLAMKPSPLVEASYRVSRKTAKIITFALILLCLYSPAVLAQEYNPKDFTKLKWDFPAQGFEGDPDLNEYFNRDTSPEKFFRLKISDLYKLPELPDTRPRRQWWDTEKATSDQWEGQGVMIQGYILGNIELLGTTWMPLEEKALKLTISDAVRNAATFEALLTPRVIKNHKEWRNSEFSALRRGGTLVRVFGWLTWDNKGRPARWWFGPITKIEYFSDGIWRELE